MKRLSDRNRGKNKGLEHSVEQGKTKNALVLTCGDPAGIGLEIALKAWRRRRESHLPPFFLITEPQWLRDRAALLEMDVPLIIRKNAFALDDFDEALVIEPLRQPQPACRIGEPSSAAASGVIEAIECAVAHVLAGRASGLVTCPIAKKPLYEAGFAFPGHTEFLGHLAEAATGQKIKPVMMLAGDELRTVPITIHIALRQVPKQLTSDLIVETALITARDLQDKFGLMRPRLAVAGLNPHAGEGGTMGGEDETIVRPAVQHLRRLGLDVTGPLPADTMFHAAARARYDVALCMYHDQALIPVKTLGFDKSVNVTLGLPFIRTSPDHGTAFDIAAQGIASSDSLIAAMKLAAQMAQHKAKGCS